MQPVFEAIAERSNRLVGGRNSTAVHSVIDDALNLMAFTRTTPEADAALRASFPQPLSNFASSRTFRRGEIIHVPDAEVDWAEHPALLDIAQLRGFRSCLLVPLLRDGTTIGVITVTRAEFQGRMPTITSNCSRPLPTRPSSPSRMHGCSMKFRRRPATSRSHCSSRPPPLTCLRSSVARHSI